MLKKSLKNLNLRKITMKFNNFPLYLSTNFSFLNYEKKNFAEKSSKEWMNRHTKDPFVKKSKVVIIK